MKKILSTVSGVAIAVLFLWASPAMADGEHQVVTKCDSQSGWYTNPDEGDFLPEAKTDGFLFEGKDLMHRALGTPLALADVHAGSFTAVGDANKVAIKMETASPYSTIIQNPDGKFWSSRIALDAPGGQNNPVEVVTDMIGSDTKTGNPKYTNDTKVVTIGVGYYTETGSTLVKTISFHGVTYSLVCPEPSTPVSSSPTSGSPSPTKTSSAPTVKPTTTKSSSSAPVAAPVGNDTSGGLPVTGPGNIGVAAAIGAVLILGGAATLFLVRRRKSSFEA